MRSIDGQPTTTAPDLPRLRGILGTVGSTMRDSPAPVDAASQPPSKGRGWHPPTVLRLQSLAGNRAVTGVLGGDGHGRTLAVQRRRIPSDATTAPLLAVAATDRAAHIEGLERLNARSLASLTAADQAAVMAAAHAAAGGAAAYAAAERAVRARALANALRTLHPTLVLGDRRSSTPVPVPPRPTPRTSRHSLRTRRP